MPANPEFAAAKASHNARRRDLRRQGALVLGERHDGGLSYFLVHTMLLDRWSDFRRRHGGLATDSILRGEQPDHRPLVYFVAVLDDGVNEGEIQEEQILAECGSVYQAWLLVSRSDIPVIAYLVVEAESEHEHHLAEEFFSTAEYNTLLS